MQEIETFDQNLKIMSHKTNDLCKNKGGIYKEAY